VSRARAGRTPGTRQTPRHGGAPQKRLLRPGTLISGLAGRHDHLITGRALRRLAARHLQLQRLEQPPVPLHLVAFDLLTGSEVRLCDGPRRSRRPPSCARSTPSGQGRSSAGWPARAPYPRRIRAARQRLRELLLAEHGRHYYVAAGWDRYTALTAAAAVACHVQDVATSRAIWSLPPYPKPDGTDQVWPVAETHCAKLIRPRMPPGVIPQWAAVPCAVCTRQGTADGPACHARKGSAPGSVWTVRKPSLRRLDAVAQVSSRN